MSSLTIVCAAASFAELLSMIGALRVGVGLAIVAVALALAIGWRSRSRRRLAGDLRSVVEALEELRSGRGRGQTEVASDSRIALIGDAVHRLGIDLHSTWSEAETAAERWRAVTDATHDTAIITTDTDGDIRSFSAGACQLTGWDETEVLTRPAAVLFDENSYKDLLPKLARRSLRSQGVTTRSRMVRRDGSSFRAETSVRMLMGSSSQPVGFMMLVRDITEQVRLESELRDSERRYRGLVEGLSEGVFIVRDGRIVYANPAAEVLTGCKAATLVGSAWRDRVATSDVLVSEAALEALAAGQGEGARLHCTLLGSGGSERAGVRIRATPVEFGGGPAAMLLVEDETDERRIAEELRRNELRLDAVLEATSDGLLVLSNDPGRTVQLTNRAFASMFDLRVEQLLGASERRLEQLLLGACAGAEALLAPIVGDGIRGQSLTLDGEGGREVHVTAAPLRGASGERLGTVLACRDVTVDRQTQRELQEQAEQLQRSKLELEQSYQRLNEINHNLEHRGAELDQLNQELRRLDKMKSDLIGNVSHELQTPLVSIRGYTEMILKERLGPISEEQRKGLRLSLTNIDRLISMIDNLLAFSRTDPSLREIKLSRFALGSLMEEARTLLHEQIADKQLDVSGRIEGGELTIQADRDKILQVFLNVLSNAVKFTGNGGRIEISASPGEAGHATVSIKDDGIGIPRESVDRVFERHFQAHAPEGGGATGSGIGLTIVRDILRLHGCTIRVTSEPERGSEFTFTLPLAEAEPQATVSHEEVASESDAAPVETQPPPEAPASRVRELPAERPTAARRRPPASRPVKPRLRIVRRYPSAG